MASGKNHKNPTSKKPSSQANAPAEPDKHSQKSSPDRHHEDSSSAISVVGIGASAGGLEAFKNFFQAMPPHSDMAFVLVQHLDPNHESMMTDLLAKYTQMPVLEIENDMLIVPNTVFMIPPNKYLFVKNGRLHLTEPVVKRGMRMPIDFLFRSMAEELQERAICIVLSGTGADGTLGLRAIKGEGGTALVQEPSSAQYDGMPQNAISTGLVDFILPPEQMPKALMKYVQHARWDLVDPNALPVSKPDDLQSILSLLRTRTNHDFRCYKKGTLLRRIHRRISLRQAENYSVYLKLLRDDAAEVKALLRDLLIGVTSFFRDPEAWNQLEKHALTQILAKKDSNSHFRIWVPGCCSGEEAYSLAMLIMELQSKLGTSCNVQIFASDIDDTALETARNGLYPENIAADVTPERLQRFFDSEEGFYRVNKPIRDMIVFANQNLVRDPPFSKLDLISCRNLLIYLDSTIQKQIISLMHFALTEGGYLFLGPSESTAQQEHLFETVVKKWRIYRRIGFNQRYLADFPALSLNDDRQQHRPQHGLPREPRPGSITALAHEILLEEYVPATAIVNRRAEAIYYHGPISNYLELTSGEPTRNIIEMAREGLKVKLRSGLQRSIRLNETVLISSHIQNNRNSPIVNIKIRPLSTPSGAEGLLLVTFENDKDAVTQTQTAEVTEQLPEEMRQLEYELTATREDLQSTIEELETSNEELKASNEEVMSMNEELQSTNEELETSKEELQSLNEELTTVNNQLQERVQELEGANNDIDNLLNSTSVATLFLDRQFQVRRFTPTATRLFRLIPSDVGRHLADIALRFTNGHLLDIAKQVLSDLQPVEKTIIGEDGSYYLSRILPYRTSDDRIDGVVLTFIDITTLKRLEDELRISEDRFRCFMDNSPAIAWIKDAEGRYVFINKAYENRFDVQLKEFSGKTDADLWPKDVAAVFRENDRKVLKTKKPLETTEVAHASHGDNSYWRSFKFLINDIDGHFFVGCISVEITEQKQAEEKLQLSEARLKAIIDGTSDAIYVKDLNGIYSHVNTSAAQYIGKPIEDILGRDDTYQFPFDDARLIMENDRRILSSGQVLTLEERLTTADGVQRIFLSTKGPVFADNKKINGLFGISRDVTEAKIAEKQYTDQLTEEKNQAELANRAKSDFLANMSHEIRTPMQSVLGMAQLIRRSGLNDKQQAQLDKLENAGLHLVRLIDMILDLAKIESDKLKLEEQPLQIDKIIGDITTMLGQMAHEKNIELVTRIDYLPHYLVGDSTRLKQAILNYASNAVKFTPKGQIEIHVEVLEDHPDWAFIRFAVQDTGIGIQANDLNRLFHSFEQVDNSSTRKFGGTGLGLAITKKLALLMGGTTGAESQPGSGSTFWFTAKFKKCPELFENAIESIENSQITFEKLQSNYSNTSVLLVEDDPFVREFCHDILDDARLKVTEADNGVEALAKASKESFALILMDMRMPIMDGLEATRQIRRLPAYHDVPIIALTANAFEENRIECLEAGMNDFVTKPVDIDALYAKLLHWLSLSQS